MKYLVTLSRRVVEEATVEVEADDRRSAQYKVQDLPDDELPPFTPTGEVKGPFAGETKPVNPGAVYRALEILDACCSDDFLKYGDDFRKAWDEGCVGNYVAWLLDALGLLTKKMRKFCDNSNSCKEDERFLKTEANYKKAKTRIDRLLTGKWKPKS